MHEELYIGENSRIRYAMLVFAILLLPFSLFVFAVVDGVPGFSFRLNLPLVVLCLLTAAAFPEKDARSLMRFAYPYIGLLVFEFLRFGVVSLFNLALPTDEYFVSAFFMLAALGYSFILFFIAQGKMRTKIFLILWSVLMTVLAVLSMSFGILPFFAYSDITSGTLTVSVSDFIAFLLLNACPLLLAAVLKDDKVKAERKARKQQR